jgi:hypothetical protein
LVLDAVECSKQMMQGSKKDSWYTTKIILTVMRNIDPHKQRINNYDAFDGASVVQNAAESIQEHFPAIAIMQGIRHTVSTIMGGWIGLCPIKDLCRFPKKVITYITYVSLYRSSYYLFLYLITDV